jgi:hypothetical protein
MNLATRPSCNDTADTAPGMVLRRNLGEQVGTDGKASNLYSRCVQVEFRLGQRLKFLIVLITPSRYFQE